MTFNQGKKHITHLLFLFLLGLNVQLSNAQTLQPMRNNLFSSSICLGDTLRIDVSSTNVPGLDSLSLAVSIDTNQFQFIGYHSLHPFLDPLNIQISTGNPIRFSFNSLPNQSINYGNYSWMQMILVPKVSGSVALPWDTSGHIVRDSIGQPYESILWFDLSTVVRPVIRTTIFRSICQGDSSFFSGSNLFASGSYFDTLQSIFSCDSIVELNLTVISDSVVQALQGICQNGNIFWGNYVITSPGLYIDTLINQAGCDSIVHLQVFPWPSPVYDLYDTICSGQRYLFFGDTLMNYGVYPHITTSFNGCDSTVVLHLEVLPSFRTHLVDTVCSGLVVSFGNQLIQTGQSGTYLYADTLSAINSCDSIVLLELFVVPITRDTIRTNLCFGDSVLFNNRFLRQSGFYLDTLSNFYGCDSLIILNLIVNPQNSQTLIDTLCPGQTMVFGGLTLSSPGTYTDTLTGYNGCDSLVVLQLYPGFRDSVNLSVQLCYGLTYPFNGVNLDTAGIFTGYFQNVWGCDSIVRLNLSFNPNYYLNVFDTLCAGDTLFIGNQYVTNTTTIHDSLLSVAGCDSIVSRQVYFRPWPARSVFYDACVGDTIWFNGSPYYTTTSVSDTVNSLIGCDSILIFNLNVHPNLFVTIRDTICPGDTRFFGNQALTNPGFYYDTLQSNYGCDSVVELRLLVGRTDSLFSAVQLCQGSSYLFNGQIITSPGLYRGLYRNSWGCDSVVLVQISLLPSYSQSVFDTVCANDTAWVNGQMVTSNSVIVDSLLSVNGCDSLAIHHVFFTPLPVRSIPISLCAGDTFWLNGLAYFQNQILNDTIPNILGCDSIIRHHIMVISIPQTFMNAVVCLGQSYQFNGINIQTPGIYYDTLQSVYGCDSVIVLNLVQQRPISVSFNQTICLGDSLFFNQQFISQAGVYLDTLISIVGCDSIYTSLNVTIHVPVRDTIRDSICHGQYYLFGMDTIRSGGLYIDTIPGSTGCDSVKLLFLHVLPNYDTTINVTYPFGSYYVVSRFIFNTTGRFVIRIPAVNGCDSTITLHLIIEPPVTIGGGSNGSNPPGGPGNWGPGSGYHPFTTVIDNVYGCVGDTIEIPVWLYNAVGVTGIRHAVDFDSTKIKFVGLRDVMPQLANSTLNYNASTNPTPVGPRHQFRLTWSDTAVLNINYAVLYKIRALVLDTGLISMNWDLVNSGNSEYLNAASVPITGSVWHGSLTRGGARLYKRRVSVCQGQSFNFYGLNLISSGIYVKNISGQPGCDSIIHMDFWVNDTAGRNITWSICSGNTVTFNGSNLSNPGVYVSSHLSHSGCDSIVILNLEVLGNSSTTIYDTVPYGTLYQVGPYFFDRPGTYTTIFRSANGCDSVLTLHIVFSPRGRIMTSLSGAYGLIGDTVTLSINIKNLNPFSGLFYHIDYDSSLLQFVSMDSVAPRFNNLIYCIDSLYSTSQGIRKKLVINGPLASNLNLDTFRLAQLKFRILRPGASRLRWLTDSLNLSTYYNGNGSVVDSLVWSNGWVVGGVSHRYMDDTICKGSTYQFGLQTLDSSGLYLSIQPSSGMLDSITILRLYVIDNPDTPQISINLTRDTLFLNGLYNSVVWFRNNVPQPFYGNFLPITVGGTHTYIAVGRSLRCGNDTSAYFVWPTSSVSNITSPEIWRISPNPTDGFVTVFKRDLSILTPVRISLLNYAGHIVFDKLFTDMISDHKLILDFTNLPSSMYILRISESSKTDSFYRLIIY